MAVRAVGVGRGDGARRGRARIHNGGNLLAELGPRGAGGTQHVACRQLDETPLGDELLGLGSLAGCWRAEQDQVHFFLPPNLARLIMPSYWWPIRCDWICATVSMVTDTTISSDVPPI